MPLSTLLWMCTRADLVHVAKRKEKRTLKWIHTEEQPLSSCALAAKSVQESADWAPWKQLPRVTKTSNRAAKLGVREVGGEISNWELYSQTDPLLYTSLLRAEGVPWRFWCAEPLRMDRQPTMVCYLPFSWQKWKQNCMCQRRESVSWRKKDIDILQRRRGCRSWTETHHHRKW